MTPPEDSTRRIDWTISTTNQNPKHKRKLCWKGFTGILAAILAIIAIWSQSIDLKEKVAPERKITIKVFDRYTCKPLRGVLLLRENEGFLPFNFLNGIHTIRGKSLLLITDSIHFKVNVDHYYSLDTIISFENNMELSLPLNKGRPYVCINLDDPILINLVKEKCDIEINCNAPDKMFLFKYSGTLNEIGNSDLYRYSGGCVRLVIDGKRSIDLPNCSLSRSSPFGNSKQHVLQEIRKQIEKSIKLHRTSICDVISNNLSSE